MNQQLLRMSKELEIGLVCTNDVHYTYESDAEAHDVLLCIQTGKRCLTRTGCAMMADSFRKERRADESAFPICHRGY